MPPHVGGSLMCDGEVSPSSTSTSTSVTVVHPSLHPGRGENRQTARRDLVQRCIGDNSSLAFYDARVFCSRPRVKRRLVEFARGQKHRHCNYSMRRRPAGAAADTELLRSTAALHWPKSAIASLPPSFLRRTRPRSASFAVRPPCVEAAARRIEWQPGYQPTASDACREPTAENKCASGRYRISNAANRQIIARHFAARRHRVHLRSTGQSAGPAVDGGRGSGGSVAAPSECGTMSAGARHRRVVVVNGDGRRYRESVRVEGPADVGTQSWLPDDLEMVWGTAE